MSCLNIFNKQELELYHRSQTISPDVWSFALLTAIVCKSSPDADWQGLAQLTDSVSDLTLQAVGPNDVIQFL